MEHKIRRAGAILLVLSLLWTIIAVGLFPAPGMLHFLPLVYSVPLGLVLLFAAPWIGSKGAASLPAARVSLRGSEQRLLLLFGGILFAAGGSVVLWFHVCSPLWDLHTIFILVAVGGTGGILLPKIAGHLNPERGRRLPESSPGEEQVRFFKKAAFGCVLAAVFAWSNSLLDRSLPETREIAVVGRSSARSKNRSRTYYANLGILNGGGYTGWAEKTRITVDKETYRAIVPDKSRAIVTSRKGFWLIPWIAASAIKNPDLSAESAAPTRMSASPDPLPALDPRDFPPPESYREEFWPGGQKKERVPLVANQPEGIGEYWHPNGALYAKIPWRKGQKDGAFRLYRADGSIEQELRYRAGKPHGRQRWLRADGSLAQEATYENGQAKIAPSPTVRSR